jgi:hypothetical protein
LLLPVGLAILATSFVLADGRRGWRTWLQSVLVGAVTWAGAQVVYVFAHIVAGVPLDAERFGPQWAQALGLIVAHAVFLGIPSGAVAGLLLNIPPLRGRTLGPADAA